jgi:Putative peptidoglycan binding domain
LQLRKAIVLLAACLISAPGPVAAATAKKSTAKKAGVRKKHVVKKRTAAGKKSTQRRPVTSARKKTSSKHSKHTRYARRAPARQTWRTGQMEPTPDRYKAIQEALVKKGYLHGEATGKWDQDSVDALRRFQQDQNLQPSGKLDSLSLIALGLGPKYAAASKPASAQP